MMIIRPQNPHRLSLGSFRKIGDRLNRLQIMHSLALGSFRRFQTMIISPQNPRMAVGFVRHKSHSIVRSQNSAQTQLAPIGEFRSAGFFEPRCTGAQDPASFVSAERDKDLNSQTTNAQEQDAVGRGGAEFDCVRGSPNCKRGTLGRSEDLRRGRLQ